MPQALCSPFLWLSDAAEILQPLILSDGAEILQPLKCGSPLNDPMPQKFCSHIKWSDAAEILQPLSWSDDVAETLQLQKFCSSSFNDMITQKFCCPFMIWCRVKMSNPLNELILKNFLGFLKLLEIADMLFALFKANVVHLLSVIKKIRKSLHKIDV